MGYIYNSPSVFMKRSDVFYPVLSIVHLGSRNGNHVRQCSATPAAGERSCNGIPELKVTAPDKSCQANRSPCVVSTTTMNQADVLAIITRPWLGFSFFGRGNRDTLYVRVDELESVDVIPQ